MNHPSQGHTPIHNQPVSNSETSEGNPLDTDRHGFMMSHMGHHEVRHSQSNGAMPLPVIPILLIVMLAFHIVMIVILSRTGSAAFSFNNPMSYGMIALLFVFVVGKVKYVVGIIRRKGKQASAEFANGGRSTPDIQREQHEETLPY